MPTPPSSHYLNRNCLCSLYLTIAVIGGSEMLVLLLLDMLNQWQIVLSPIQNVVLNTALLTALCAPVLWFLALRPLTLQVDQKQTQDDEPIVSNKGLLEALEAHVLISISDVRGRIVYANDMFCKLSGYSQQELIGKDHRIVNSGHHDQDYIRSMWHTIAGGHVWKGEFCNRNKSGELYWVDSTIAPLLDKDGKPKQYLSIRRDITRRKANELKLTALKRALDASSEMILITDATGSIDYANPALCLFTGWTEEALIGQKPYILDSPSADRQALSEMQSRLRCSEAWSGRLRGRRRSDISTSEPINDNLGPGSTASDTLEYWAKTNITPILTATGTLLGYVQIQHDVSKQVEQEAALHIEADDTAAHLAISEALHRPLPLEQRVVQVLTILFGLKALDLQRKGCVLLRSQNDSSLEKFVALDLNVAAADDAELVTELLGPKQRITIGDNLCGHMVGAKDLTVVNDCCCCGDKQSHGHYLLPIVSGEDILGVLLAFTDAYPVQSESRLAMLKQVSDMIALALLQHQANTSLEAARDAALQVAQTKTDFLANMSHEIRTPMNGVLGMLDLLQDTQLSREQWDLIEIAANSAESLLTIINDILDFSKLEAGKIEFELIEFNLPDLVEEVCSLLSSRAHSKGLELNCFLPANLPLRWQGDPTRIRQVLTNLIGNAVKFTEKGEVSVKVSLSKNDAGVLRFEVMDTGIGITAEAQARLFQAFSQADSTTSRRYGGTGLGLSISKDLVVLMGGDIGVDSSLGQGSNFWFNLPLTQVDSDAPVPQANFADKRALIVDDNATNRMILTHYLSTWGFTLSEVDNGSAAVIELEAAVLRNEPYDLLLSDMQMPGMDGFSLAHAIAEKPIIAHTPRILLSSGTIGSEAERLAAGFSQSLLKPVRQSQLFDAIIDALQHPTQKTAPAPKIREPLLDYSGKRILVVEDNKVNQKVIIAQLAKFRINPDLTNNGQAALDQLALQNYDLVFMDCQMPIMDGYEATRSLREQEAAAADQRHTPITALTAHASAGEREKCLAAGMDDYLSKPLNRADLAVVLERWLGSVQDQPLDPTSSVYGESPDAASPEHTDAPQDKPDERPDNTGGLPGSESGQWNEQAALKRLDGDHDLLVEMIDLFLEEAPVQLAELAAALARTDLPALADAAHALKGMAGHFCAENLISLAINLEHSARKSANADFQLMTHDLSQATAALVESLLRRKEHIHE